MPSSRRDFLAVVAAGSAATCLVGVSGCAARLEGTYEMGHISDLPEGGSLTTSGVPLAVLRDATGLWAVTTLCTHLQCDMLVDGTVTPTGSICTCHGSEFSADGAVTVGPALRPLDNFAVSLSADTGIVTVDADTTVDPGTRTDPLNPG